MTFKKLFFLLFSMLMISPVFAQEEISIERISVVNLGDGRLLHRVLNSESPLNGKHRIMDGYRSEYVLVEFQNGLYHGGYQKYKNNKLQEEGTYAEGVKNGVFKDYHNDGETVKTERTLLNGKLDGIYKSYDSRGNVTYEKGYKEGVEHGIERRYRDGKVSIDCHYSEGQKQGRQVEHLISNKGDFTKTSEYDKGVLVGEYSEVLDEDEIMRTHGFYKNGEKDGVWVYRGNSGTLEKEETYKDGDRIKLTVFYVDGSPEKTTEYANGKRNGLTTAYHWETGNLKSEYMYRHNRKEGEYKLYYPDGILMEEGKCENDREVYKKEYDEKGVLKHAKKRTNTGAWETVE